MSVSCVEERSFVCSVGVLCGRKVICVQCPCLVWKKGHLCVVSVSCVEERSFVCSVGVLCEKGHLCAVSVSVKV